MVSTDPFYAEHRKNMARWICLDVVGRNPLGRKKKLKAPFEAPEIERRLLAQSRRSFDLIEARANDRFR